MALAQDRGVSRRKLLASMMAGAAAASFPRTANASIVRPKMTIILIAEQFRSDYLFRNYSALSATGFRRLMDESAFFPNCRLLSNSFTLTGLATVATGTYAAMHGIVADRWYDSTERRLRVAAPADLTVPTLFQQEAEPDDRLFTIAASATKAQVFQPDVKDRMFFTNEDGAFTTFGTAGKESSWLAAFNSANASDQFRDRPWTAHGAPVATPPLRTLTYDATKPGNFRALWGSSPFAQSAEINLIREMIHGENLGMNSSDTVVAVLDSIGKLGSETGAVSPLIDDEVLSLDADVAALLEWLDARGLPYQFVFTAAHGAPSQPSPTSRVSPEEIVTAVEKAMAREFAKGNSAFRFVEAYVYPFLYLRPDHLPAADLPRARKVAGTAAVATGRVATFMTADGYSPHFTEWDVRAKNSLYPGRSGDVLLAYRPGFVEYVGADRGVSYGSLWNYDAQVPLLMKGPSFLPGRFDHMVELTDIAPTLAAVAGLPPPAAATGRVLTEAFGQGVS